MNVATIEKLLESLFILGLFLLVVLPCWALAKLISMAGDSDRG